MPRYISLLRGINVSGRRMIRMEALRAMFESMGFGNVVSYLQSGNVVFNSKKQPTEKLSKAIAASIESDFGFDVPVITLDVEKLLRIIQGNPFANDSSSDPAHWYVTFLADTPAPYDAGRIEEKKQTGEAIVFTDEAVYLYCPGGYGNTKLSNTFLESKLKVVATTRNWKTTTELLRLAGSDT